MAMNGCIYDPSVTSLRVTDNAYIIRSSLLEPSSTTRRDGQMSRASISRAGRSGNPKVADWRSDPVGLIPGQVTPMTLKLICVASLPGAQHY